MMQVRRRMIALELRSLYNLFDCFPLIVSFIRDDGIHSKTSLGHIVKVKGHT